MKNYELKDFTNLDELLQAVVKDVKPYLMDQEGQGRLGAGRVINVEGGFSNFICGFIIEVQFTDRTIKLDLQKAYQSGAFKLGNQVMEVVNKYQEILNIASAEQKAIEDKKWEEKRVKEKAEKEAEEAEKEKEKYENYVKNNLNNLKTLSNNSINMHSGIAKAIGWLAKNTTNITAAMPDFCESWFRRMFGDAKARIVDQKKKGPSGWSSQWAFSLNMNIKEEAKNNIPTCLREYTDGNRNHNVNNTRFIFTLIQDYGFQIGRKQDVEEIRKHIPEKYLEDFEEGYNA